MRELIISRLKNYDIHYGCVRWDNFIRNLIKGQGCGRTQKLKEFSINEFDFSICSDEQLLVIFEYATQKYYTPM